MLSLENQRLTFRTKPSPLTKEFYKALTIAIAFHLALFFLFKISIAEGPAELPLLAFSEVVADASLPLHLNKPHLFLAPLEKDDSLPSFPPLPLSENHLFFPFSDFEPDFTSLENFHD